MKLSCLQESLNHGLSIVGRAVATRTTLPITKNVLLATDTGRLKLAANNLEMGINCWISAKIEEEGDITVPAELLAEFVKCLPGETIAIDLVPGNKNLALKCARFEAHISGVDARQFPPIPVVDEGIDARVEVESLQQAIEHVVFAAAVDESRPVLSGVCAQFDGQGLTLAAADGFRLAVYKMSVTSPVRQKTEVVIPARTLAELYRVVNNKPDEAIDIKLNPNKSRVLFRLKNIDLVSMLIQGTFPKYTELIPQKYNTRVIVSVTDFLQVVETASVFGRDSSSIVRLVITAGNKFSPGKISVSARSEDIGDDIGEIDAIVEGDDAKIAFNGKLLADVLSRLKEEQVALEISGPSSPGLIRPVGTDKYIYLVMPMFVQW